MNLHLAISKLPKMCAHYRVGAEDLFYNSGSGDSKRRAFRSMRTSILERSNAILAAIEGDSYVTGLHIDFSTGDQGINPNALLLIDGLRGMLEGKDYRVLDMVFPFIGARIHRCR